jgi:N-acetylglutamate synthase-like GNAT family acetyltransferase
MPLLVLEHPVPATPVAGVGTRVLGADDPALPAAVAAAEVGFVAGGGAIPRGAVAELTGIATLPAWRRRGVGAMVTAALTQAAASVGVRTVFLSAGDEEVARVYERVGFRRVASVGEAVQATAP